MVKISLDLSTNELEMLIFCIDSAIDIVNFTKEEKEKAIKLRDELRNHL